MAGTAKASAAASAIRADYGVHFKTQFPLGTNVHIEVGACDDAAGLSEAVSGVVAKGLIGGVWISSRCSDTESADATSAQLLACARAVRKSCPRTWIGLRPRHLAHSSQFGWLSRKLPSALGLWTDGMLVDPTEPADKRNAAARGVWQEITTSRALGKWDGLGFGTVVGLSEPDAAGRALDDVCCAASFVLDCLIVDSAKEGASRAHLDAVKRLRQAVVTVAPPLSSEAELRNYLISLAGVADGVILGCPTENPQNAFEYLGKLSEWLSSVHQDSLKESAPTPDGVDCDSPKQENPPLSEPVEPQSAPAQPDPPSPAKPPAGLTSLLSRQLRVELSDGRVIYGCLACTDPSQNLVLCNTEEYGPGAGNSAADKGAVVYRRHLGMVMVPGEHIVSAAVETKT